MTLTISAPLPATTTPQVPPRSPAPGGSLAASNFERVSNRPRVAELADRMLERLRSGMSRVFDGIRNLRHLLTECLPRKATVAPEASQPPVDLHAESLAAGANALLRVIPKMCSVLQSDDAPARAVDTFAADFRALRAGLRGLQWVAKERIGQGVLPAHVARALDALLEPTAITAGNRTQDQLEARLAMGETGFLADPPVQIELHAFFERARDAAVALATQEGARALAQRLDALCRAEREIA